MKFVDKVKIALLERKEEELAIIDEEIKELNKKYTEENENVENLKQESNESAKDKSKVQKNVITKKELKDLENIYEFVANYPKIEKILEKIKEIISSDNNYIAYIETDTNEMTYDNELNARYQLYSLLKKLNEQIIEIKDADIDDLLKKDEVDNKKTEKKSIFSRIFRKRDKNKENSSLDIESNSKEEEIIFDKYRKTIDEYKKYYNELLDMHFEEGYKMDKIESTKIITLLNSILAAKKRGFELDEEDEIYLAAMQPIELWNEIYKYYSNMGIISNIIQNFERNIDRYEQLYEKDPKLFDLENLERIFSENDQMIIDLKSKNKTVTSKFNELASARQSKDAIKSQLKSSEAKKEAIVKKIEQIKNAKTLKDLGYKNKEDAVKKLSLDTKDYIVVPIPNNIKNIEELFNEEKEIKVGIDGKTFLGTYSNDIATGRINSIESNENTNTALMVPINLLRKEDIDNIKSGKIGINKSVLQTEKLLAIMPEDRNIEFGNSKIETNKYSYGDITQQVKNFLGEDYVTESDEIENYEVLKNIPNVSSKEKKYKREAVKKCLFENIKRDISHTDIISVNGKTYFLNKDDEKDLQLRSKTEPLNIKKLQHIADDIDTYLIGDENNSFKIDSFYEKLLLEYLRINKKAKADYQEETDTTVMINGKNISIKPTLPAKDETIAKRYSRPMRM